MDTSCHTVYMLFMVILIRCTGNDCDFSSKFISFFMILLLISLLAEISH